MSYRKHPLVQGQVYHTISKSIAGFCIFRNHSEFERIKKQIKYYQISNLPLGFADFCKIKDKDKFLSQNNNNTRLVSIIAYCLMPTHIHLIIRQETENGISRFMSNVLNSYSRYFNVKTKRKGPLWESRFKNILVETEEQLLHLTRYIHLNPSTAQLVINPSDWQFSSYKEFINNRNSQYLISDDFKTIISNPKAYQQFVNSRIEYQCELAHIKKLFIE